MYLTEAQLEAFNQGTLDLRLVRDRLCPICLENIERDDLTRIFFECRHVEHLACSDNWNRGRREAGDAGCCICCVRGRELEELSMSELDDDDDDGYDWTLSDNENRFLLLAAELGIDFRVTMTCRLPDGGFSHRVLDQVTNRHKNLLVRGNGTAYEIRACDRVPDKFYISTWDTRTPNATKADIVLLHANQQEWIEVAMRRICNGLLSQRTNIPAFNTRLIRRAFERAGYAAISTDPTHPTMRTTPRAPDTQQLKWNSVYASDDSFVFTSTSPAATFSIRPSSMYFGLINVKETRRSYDINDDMLYALLV
jgi:hypothetical protein